jgi:CO/xanthine dehydrogenase Mo-binding subunit
MTRALQTSGVRAKLRGEALYARDLLDRRLASGTAAVAGVVRSPHAHARLVRVEVERALAVPGVLAVLTGADFAGIRLGSEVADEPVLAQDRVRYVGDHVAAVAAKTPDALRAGLAAVEVEYEPLPAMLTPGEAAAGQAVHERGNVAYEVDASRGDWEAAAGQVTAWAEGDFEVRPVQHAYMEPYAMLACYEPGQVTLWVATHAPSKIKEEYEPWAERGSERLELLTPAFGGAFGAKYEHPLHLVCAELARRLRQDVGLVLSRREDFLGARPRVDMRLRVRVGADSDGRLLVKSAAVEANNGAASGHGPSVVLAALTRMDNLYRYRAVRDRGRLLYTNTAPTECYRGFGDPEAVFAQEQLVDELAHRLGIDPCDLRRRNAVADGDTSVHGWKITSTGFSECLEWVRQALEQDLAQAPAGKPRGRHRTGYGVAPGMHVTSNRGRVDKDFSAVALRAAPDGRLTLMSSEVDVGTGTGRVLSGLAAGVLEIDPGAIDVVLGDTEHGPPGLGSYASRTTYFAGNACLFAARELRVRAARLAAELGLPDATLPRLAGELERRGRLAELRAVGEFAPEDDERPDDSGYGNRSPAYTFAVHGCKVSVDTWTGRVRVLRYWAAHDAGTVLDPAGAEGQVIGGVLQGLGHALSEEAVRGPDGRMLNPGFLDYRIPTALDSVPVEVFFSGTFDPGGPLGAKSLAEPPIIPVAGCVANAIHDATGVRLRRLPMTPEAVLGALSAAGVVSG